MTHQIISKMIQYFGSDVRRINHALKVYGFAKGISEGETLTDEQRLIVEFTALLHDIGIPEAEKKYNSSAGHYQEIEGPAIAQMLLVDSGYSQDFIDRICYIIGHHHTYQMIDGIDFQIIVEADFLVNIHEEEMTDSMKINIYSKYFKTNTGRKLMETMYLSKNQP